MALALYGFVVPKRRVEPAGISYEYSIIKDKLALGLSTHPVLQIDESAQSGEGDGLEEELTDWMDPEDAKYKKYIGRLDPNNAKEQDHYKLLGLSKLRYRATQAQIKAAYRHKVLIYHPDKGKAKGDADLRTELVFACIQKAYEQLGLSEDKRHAFDSVDPQFDETVPDSVEPAEFFQVLGPVFERNARFSINQPVPLLGDADSPRSHVEHFYEFWFDWKSWREFSYLDAEDKTKGEDRWERREIEKQNKAEREKCRKRDLRRISGLVELAYSKDPRVVKFKEEDKRRKQEMKEHRRREKQAKEQAELEEQNRQKLALEEERRRQEEEEKRAAQARQQKKKVLATQRRRLRDLASASNYWLGKAEADKQQQRMLAITEQIERICLCAEFEQLSAVCEQLAGVGTYEQAHATLRECGRRKEEEQKVAANGQAAKNGDTGKAGGGGPALWSPTELQLLVKAVNLYPPGTQERWKQVAEYVSYHNGDKPRTEKDVIKQVKLLKSDPNSSSSPAAKMKDSSSKPEEEVKTNSNSPAALEDAGGEEGWSAEQQRQLEQALKGTEASDPERWDKIAAAVEGKSRKQCIRRYKRLAEMVKQAKTSTSTTAQQQQ